MNELPIESAHPSLNRRRALALFGGTGLAAVVGAKVLFSGAASAASDGSTATSVATVDSADSAGTTCTVIPEETAGPYPGDGSNGPNVLDDDGVIRQDITTSFGDATAATAEGVPLTINLTISDTAAGCVPLAGAAVYLWHCDREGRYSLYSQGLEDINYLRGVQETDAEGNLTFTTIFPACYSGRWPHAHFEIYPSAADAVAGTNLLATSQIAFPQSECDLVYAEAGYEDSVGNMQRLSLESDNVFGDDGGVHQLATMTGSVADGYTATLAVGI